jgi:hypothetical protein
MNELMDDDFTNTNRMMTNLEQEIMWAQVQQALQEEMSVISSYRVDNVNISDQPSRWLGNTISNRSLTNLMDLDDDNDGKKSRRSQKSQSGSRSRSNSGHHRRSSSRQDRKKGQSSSLKDIRERNYASQKRSFMMKCERVDLLEA